jgi:glutamate racemase
MAKIGVFDSGVGGVTVLREIKKVLPQADIIYYGDNINAPYGDLSIERIRELSLKIVEFLVLNRVDAVVIACSVATAISIDVLKERFPQIPIIGVIDTGAKIGVETTKNNCIGVFSTPATVSTEAYPKAIKTINPDIQVFQKCCIEFCPKIEEGWEDTLENEEIVKEYLSCIPENVDTLILGCTHYPIIKDTISRNFSGEIVDSSEETAIALKKELLLNSGKRVIQSKGSNEYYISGDTKKFKKVADGFLGEKIEKIYQIRL